MCHVKTNINLYISCSVNCSGNTSDPHLIQMFGSTPHLAELHHSSSFSISGSLRTGVVQKAKLKTSTCVQEDHQCAPDRVVLLHTATAQ